MRFQHFMRPGVAVTIPGAVYATCMNGDIYDRLNNLATLNSLIVDALHKSGALSDSDVERIVATMYEPLTITEVME